MKSENQRLEAIRYAARTGFAVDIDGMTVLPQMAVYLLSIYERLTPENRARFLRFDVHKMCEMAEIIIVKVKQRKGEWEP